MLDCKFVANRFALAALALALAAPAMARNRLERAVEAVGDAFEDRPAAVQHNGPVEVGFSPREGAERLVLRVIDSARAEVRVLAYSFTSAPVTRALLAARRRGVDVALVVDYKANVTQDGSGKARHALGALVNAGCRVRTVSAFPIMHDKGIVVDGETVETGSFNYSEAATRNSENVVVFWNAPQVAKPFLEHWQDRFGRGQDFQPGY